MPYPFEPNKTSVGFNGSASYGPHEGIDLNVAGTSGNQDCGTTEKSISNGECVHISQSTKDYGNMAIIKTLWQGKPYWIRYCHLNVITVRPGDKVKIGDKIGTMGSTGNSTACHLHLDILKRDPGTNWRMYTKSVLEWYTDPVAFIQNYKGEPMADDELMQIKKSDEQRLRKGSTLGDRLLNGLGHPGNIADKDEAQIDLIIAKYKEMESKPATSAPQMSVVAIPAFEDMDPNPNPEIWERNGLSVMAQKAPDGKITALPTYNYKLKS